MVEAAPAHAAAMALIHAAAFPAGERWDTAAFAAQLALPGVFGFLDDLGGMILGRVVADEAEVLTLAVHPRARRQGIGRGLLGALLAETGRRGATRVFLEVAEGNAPARALYAVLGFAPVGRRRGYYAAGDDGLVLCRFQPG